MKRCFGRPTNGDWNVGGRRAQQVCSEPLFVLALASSQMRAAGVDAARLGVSMTMFVGEVVEAGLH